MLLTQETSHNSFDAGARAAALRAAACVLLLLSASAFATGRTPRPALLSDPDSTRAVALESMTHAREPFAPESLIPWGLDTRTRVSLFAMNLAPRPGEDASAVSAFAEDASGRRYTLETEYVGAASGADGVTELVVRLSDDLGDVGDVLVWVSCGGLASNRVRVGIGHVGGGPSDDAGAAPTQPLLLAGVVTQNGRVFAGVEVTLEGGVAPVTHGTAADGSYSFVVAPLGGYTLTPRAPLYDFEPASRSLDTLDSSRGDLFFGARRQTHTIFGRVRDESGRPLFNYRVSLAGAPGSEPRTTTTDDSGQFAFAGVPADFDYTLSPPDEAVATFGPAHTGRLTSDVNVSIAATRRTYAIRGRLTEGGAPVQGARVVLEDRAETTTNAGGAYAFENLPAGFGYSVVLPDPDYTFTPAARGVESLLHDEQFDSAATPHYVLRGRVTDPNGRGVFGIIINMEGTQRGSTYTDGNGDYTLVATARGDYTLSPLQYQRFYSFSPPNVTLGGVASSRTNDFTGTLSSTSSPSYVLEFDGAAKDVDFSIAFDTYGTFWPEGVDLGRFFWEVWAMPGDGAGGTYMLADGYGGFHALLFGVANFGTSEPNRFQLLGNIFDGSGLTYFGSDEGPAPFEWGHYAVSWDGRHIVTYFNGVPVGRTKWAGPRRTPGPAGGGGRLHVGGSNHSNFVGRIAQVRGYEDSNPREEGGSTVYSSFRPETVFSLGGNLMSWFFRPDDLTADLSHGYQGVPHAGVVRGWAVGDFLPCLTCPKPAFVVDPTAPNFADPEHPGTPPAPVDAPASAPSGALAFDSFSRRNSTYTLGGAGGLGSTEGGSAGALAWRTGVASTSPQPFGILNGRAVQLADVRGVAWVEPGPGLDNFDVHVSRHPGAYGAGLDTGLSFRVADANNFFFAYTSEGAEGSPRLLTVGFYLNGARTTLAANTPMPATWATLRVETNAAGSLFVYADGTTVYSTQNAILSTAAGAGLYNNGPGLALANRWDNFTVFATPVH